MAELPVFTYAFATTFGRKNLAKCLDGAKVRQSRVGLVAEYAPDRLVVGFDFGALAFVNVGATARSALLERVMTTLATDEPHAPHEEEYLIEVREGAPPHGEVGFDRVVVPDLGEAGVDVITLLLAQSVTLNYYRADLQELLAATGLWTSRMARTGRSGGSTRDLIRFVASSMATRNEIIEVLALLDKPPITWEVAELDRLHRDLRAMLEIEDRFRNLEYRLRMVQDTLGILLDLSQTRRSLLLEVTIVALITFEIVLILWMGQA